MSKEVIGFKPEREHNPEALEQAGMERREQLREERERTVETRRDDEEKAARHEALENAQKTEKEHSRENERLSSPAERRGGPISKRQQEASFRSTMHEVQAHMSAPSRTFSRVIHNKAVEKVSDVAATTVARPNAILSGAIFAFILTLAVYLIAKNLGYPLSGFETIGAFALGWLLGLAYDFLKVMVTGRR